MLKIVYISWSVKENALSIGVLQKVWFCINKGTVYWKYELGMKTSGFVEDLIRNCYLSITLSSLHTKILMWTIKSEIITYH